MTRFKLRKKYSIFIVAAVLALAAGGYYYYAKNASDYAGAISTDIKGVADFTIYMPKKAPSGFILKKDSISFKQEMLFMQFTKDDQIIFMNQQKKPNPTPQLSSIKGFVDFPLSIGKAVTGEQDGVSAVIINTGTSIITITGDETVSRSDIGLLAKRLKAVN